MFTIELRYRTGNSFHSEQCTECIGHVWKDKELARKALASIKDHYDMYKKIERLGRHGREEKPSLVKEMMEKEWYVNHSNPVGLTIDGDLNWGWEYCLAVEMDDGTWRNVPTDMYIGYFEELYGARVAIEHDDNKDQFGGCW